MIEYIPYTIVSLIVLVDVWVIFIWYSVCSMWKEKRKSLNFRENGVYYESVQDLIDLYITQWKTKQNELIVGKMMKSCKP